MMVTRSELQKPVQAGALRKDRPSAEADSTEHTLMVSARKDGDFSFTMTAWGKGIAPYDFEMPYDYFAQSDILHTVFDRSLIRVGETVNMKHILRRPTLHGFRPEHPRR